MNVLTKRQTNKKIKREKFDDSFADYFFLVLSLLIFYNTEILSRLTIKYQLPKATYFF